MTRDVINGVPADQYGLWCRHGKHVMVVNPNDTSDYPGTVFADPWPCGQGCTPDSLAAEFEAEAEAFDDERWAEYNDTIREGLLAPPTSMYNSWWDQ